MGAFPTRITSDEYAMADTLVIDEGGIDLMLDGDSVMAASFEGLDIFRVMADMLTEDRIKPVKMSQATFDATMAGIKAETLEATKEDIAEGREYLERNIIANLYTLKVISDTLAAK